MTTGFGKVKVIGGFQGSHCKSVINSFLLSANTASVSFSTEFLEVISNGPELKKE